MGHHRKNLCTFILTNKCNLSCSYCWVKHQDQNYKKIVLDPDFAKKGLYDFYKETGSNYIGFFASGEPTLELALMHDINEYARNLMGDVKVELQSNGVFNRATLEWIANNVEILWISADGPKEIHDLHRTTKNGKGSAVHVERSIKELVRLKSEGHSKLSTIGIRSTIGKFNVYRQKELIDYYRGLGINAIYVDQICAPVSDEIVSQGEGIDSLTFAEQFYNAYLYAKKSDVFYGTIATMNFDEGVDIACRAMLPAPHITPGGFISSCEMCYEEGSPLDVFIYGKWDRESGTITYDRDKINQIKNRNVASLKECHGCEYIQNCAGSCAGESLNETGSLYKPNTRLCTVIKYLGSRIERNDGVYPYLHP